MPRALITGAAAGNIGGATAERLAAEGWALTLGDIQPGCDAFAADIAGRWGVPAEGSALDVRDPETIDAWITGAFERHEDITALVNAAGIARPIAPMDIDAAEFDRVMEINARGTFLTSQAFARHMMARERAGSIVTLASMAARSGGRSNGVHYAASKAAVVSLTKGLATALGPYALRVNAVAPGIIDTPMTRAIPGSGDRAAASPLQRWGRVEEVAETIVFLCGDRSSYTTGSVVDVTGGL